MPNERIKLTKREFKDGLSPYPNNMVIVRMTHNNDYAKSKGGILLGLPTRDTFAEGGVLGADMQECWGVVERVPQKLYFNPKEDDSMLWETEMELRVGDVVWFGILESANAHEIDVDGVIYKILPYQDCYVAKRGDEVICLNGYVLLSPTYCKTISELDFISQDKVDTSQGIVKFFGKANTHYANQKHEDFKDLQVGDEVLFAPRTSLQFLERNSAYATFDGDNLYYVIQRRKIVMTLNR